MKQYKKHISLRAGDERFGKNNQRDFNSSGGFRTKYKRLEILPHSGFQDKADAEKKGEKLHF